MIGDECDQVGCEATATRAGFKIVCAQFCDHHAHTEKNFGLRPTISQAVTYFRCNGDPTGHVTPPKYDFAWFLAVAFGLGMVLGAFMAMGVCFKVFDNYTWW